MASFAPSICTSGEIQRTSILQKAFEDLSGQLGIVLTEYGKQSLYGISNTEIAFETSLSKGIAAQRNNKIGEALSYYYESASFNPSSIETSDRLNILSSFVSNGNITESVHNDFQQREVWSNILKECEEFYNIHLPYEIIYNPNLSPKTADYEKRTVDLEFTLATQPTTAFNVIQDILDGLKKSGRKEAWGFPCWPLSSPVFADYYSYSGWMRPYTYSHDEYLKFPEGYMIEHYNLYKYITIEAELINRDGNIISTVVRQIGNLNKFSGDKSSYSFDYNLYQIETLPSVAVMVFKDINIDDMTDNLYIRIKKVNNIETETVNDYVNIKTTQNEIVYPEYRIYR
jgi:hypothetical protein